MRNDEGRQRFALLVACLLIVVALGGAASDKLLRPHRVALDFDTFYCAGRALNAGADPYRAEPLGACERRPLPAPLPHINPGVTMPAPLPPYAMAPFALLARLPFLAAIALWTGLILLAASATVDALRRLTALPLAALIAAFALGTLVAVALGQVAPLAVAGVSLAAYFLAVKKTALTALAASLALVEPHVGVAAWLALFVWEPRTRRWLLASAALCLALSVLLVGPAVCLEYLQAVLPQHAFAEVWNPQQLSFTHLLHRLGVADVPAVRLGELWYAFMLLLGVALAGRFVRRAPELVASLPVAFAVFGGPFIHAVQEPAALPAALILLARAENGLTRRLLGLAVVLVALPFIQFFGLGPGAILLFGAVTVVLAATLLRLPPLPSALLALAASAVPLAAWLTLPPAAATPLAALVAAYDPHALAEASWRTWFELTAPGNTWLPYDLIKIPMWLGLGLIVFAGARSAIFPAAKYRRNANRYIPPARSEVPEVVSRVPL